MNYGKFFRLNIENTCIEEGITIFEYIGFTAYDDLTSGKPMSPKYPITLVVNSTSVKFILHYCAFRSKDTTTYEFEIDNILPKSLDGLSVVHIEETLIELPFAGKGSESLTDIIKKLYRSQFPRVERNQKNNDKEEEQSSSEELAKYGNRFVYNRLNKLFKEERFPHSKVYSPSPNNGHYHIHAYSALDCMGSIGGWKTLDVFDRDGRCNGFLRKLMLDFMFDLNHSDIFQNSSNYHAMYTGLMANFYFSALLHKSEFYFYRQLLWDEAKDKEVGALKDLYGELSNFETKGEGSSASIEMDEAIKLYADKKRRAEALWVNDIMSPQAEMLFFYDSVEISIWDRTIGRINGVKNSSQTQKHSAANKIGSNKQKEWFEDPETEMRNVCFLKKNKFAVDKCVAKKVSHICPVPENRKTISQWFMRRYDFKDVYRFHFSDVFGIPVPCFGKISNYIICAVALIFALLSIIPCSTIGIHIYILVGVFLLGFFSVLYKWWIKKSLLNNLHVFFPRLAAAIATGWMTLALGFDLMVSFFDKNIISKGWLFGCAVMILILIFLVTNKIGQITPHNKSGKKFGRAAELILIGYCISVAIGIVMVNFLGKPFLERGGYIEEFYAQYDDTRFCIDTSSNNEKKGHVSYCDVNCITADDSSFFYSIKDSSLVYKVNLLEKIYHTTGGGRNIKVWYNHPIAVNVDVLNNHWVEIYCLRDITVIFAFIALFIGIFIELIIFGGGKELTEV